MSKSFDSLSFVTLLFDRYTIKEEGDEVKAVKVLHDKLHTPEKTSWTIRFLKAQSECSVSVPLSSIVDFRFVLMITFRNLYIDIKEFQLSLHLQIKGTANSKVVDSKKTQKVEPHPNRASDNKPTCTVCGASSTTKANVLNWRASTPTRLIVLTLVLLLILCW